MRNVARWIPGVSLAVVLIAGGAAPAQPPPGGLAPPTGLQVQDRPLDGGDGAILTWEPSADDPGRVSGYTVYRSLTETEEANAQADRRTKAVRVAKFDATRLAREAAEAEGLGPAETDARIRAARREAAREALAGLDTGLSGEERFKAAGSTDAGTTRVTINSLTHDDSYVFRVVAHDDAGNVSAPAITAEPFRPHRDWFDGSRGYLLLIALVFCGSVGFFIERASAGKELKIRKIAGLEAVDEAVGRATEMGRPCIYVPGIQDMNEIQTIASMTILARVSRTAAEYDVKVEVPTSRSLVMTTAREIVQAAFMQAGRPDSYNRDLIYYVTDEQFGFVAYLSGLMVREKPAACFYMGAFFAESLILAETGNSIGAIQVAGTAMPAQLPFFVAACDYTLIGEEFFAASAYLSGSPKELGSLKGQDVGKLIVGFMVATGVILATLASITGSESLAAAVEYLKSHILT